MRVLRINASTDYAVRILLLLADAGGVMPSSRLADSIGISRRYLLQVAAKLRETGLVDVVYGPTGGFKLTKALEQICLLDIFEAMEGRNDQFPKWNDKENCFAVLTDTYEKIDCQIIKQMKVINFQELLKRFKEENV
mgnify:FL=1